MITRRSLLVGSFIANLLQLAGCAPRGNSPGSGGLDTRSFKGENLAGGEYWNANDMFIDLVDNAGPDVGSVFMDPDTGVVTLPTGNGWSVILRETPRIGAIGHVKMRPGTIRVWWTGTATSAEVRVSAPDWARVTSTGSQQMEIVIPAEEMQQGGQFLFRCDNYSGSTKTIIEPHAVHADDIAAFNAGEIFDPRHLASYPPDIACIRVPHTCFVHFFDGLDKPLTSELTYSQLVRPASNHFWKHRNYQTAARLAMRLGPDVALWVNANVLMEPAGYLQIAAAIAATGFTGKLILEGGVEFWNFAYPYVMQKIRAREVIGPTVTVVDNDGNPSSAQSHVDACCYAEKSMQLWEAFAAHFPQSQLVRVLTGQTSWFDIMSPMFAYRRGGTGPRCGEIHDANAIEGYVGWTGTEEMWNAGAQNYSLAQWDVEMQTRLAGKMTSIDSYKSQALARAWSRNPNYLMYEGWHHIAVYDTYRIGRASGDAGQGVLTFAASVAGRISTGDFLYSSADWDWIDAMGSPWPSRGAFARVVDARHVTLHLTAADAAANTNSLMLKSSIRNADCTNRGRAKAISDSAMAWIHSPHGVTWSGNWWAQMRSRFNSYRCVFEPKEAGFATDGLWTFYPPPTNVHDADGLLLAWWRGVSGA
jgi:hypothetical protein